MPKAPLSEAAQLATLAASALNNVSADVIPVDQSNAILAGIGALENLARRAKDVLGRGFTRAYGVDVTERGVVVLADGPDGDENDGTPLSLEGKALKKEVKRIAGLEAAVAAAEAARDEAQRNLSNFIAKAGIAAGGSGFAAPEVVLENIEEIAAERRRLAPLVDKSAADVAAGFAENAAQDSKRIKGLLEKNSELHNEKVQLKNEIASLKRTLSAVEDQRNVGATVLENLAEDPRSGVQPLALNALAEMRLIPQLIVTANGMTDEKLQQLRLDFEKTLTSPAPASTASSSSRSLPLDAVGEDRRFAKLTSVDEDGVAVYVTVEWDDIAVGDVVSVMSDDHAPGLWLIDDVTHRASGSVLATNVNVERDPAGGITVTPVVEPVKSGHVLEVSRIGDKVVASGALDAEGVAALEKAGILKPKVSSQSIDLLGKTVAFLDGIPAANRKMLTKLALDIGAVVVTEPGDVDFLVVGSDAVVNRKVWGGAILHHDDFEKLIRAAIQ